MVVEYSRHYSYYNIYDVDDNFLVILYLIYVRSLPTVSRNVEWSVWGMIYHIELGTNRNTRDAQITRLLTFRRETFFFWWVTYAQSTCCREPWPLRRRASPDDWGVHGLTIDGEHDSPLTTVTEHVNGTPKVGRVSHRKSPSAFLNHLTGFWPACIIDSDDCYRRWPTLSITTLQESQVTIINHYVAHDLPLLTIITHYSTWLPIPILTNHVQALSMIEYC